METPNLPAPHGKFCNAKKKQGPGCCRHPAGWGTDHAGQGRCKFHGGTKKIKHGLRRRWKDGVAPRWSDLKHERLRELIAKHNLDVDPLNLLPDLAACRAMFQDYIERYNEWRDALIHWHETQRSDYNPDDDEAERPSPMRPTQILDVADAYRILSEATKIAKRIEDVRAQNAISRADFFRVMTEMGRVVELHERDDATLEKIRTGWGAIRLA